VPELPVADVERAQQHYRDALSISTMAGEAPNNKHMQATRETRSHEACR
jgi:hypothetical protein